MHVSVTVHVEGSGLVVWQMSLSYFFQSIAGKVCENRLGFLGSMHQSVLLLYGRYSIIAFRRQ